MTTVESALAATKAASNSLGDVSVEKTNKILLNVADALESNAKSLLKANQKDVANMKADDPMLDRLTLTVDRIKAMADDVRTVATLPSPLGLTLEKRTRPNGLQLTKVSVPLGVIGPLSVRTFAPLIRGDAKAADGCLILRITNFGINAETADEKYSVQTHVRNSSKLLDLPSVECIEGI